MERIEPELSGFDCPSLAVELVRPKARHRRSMFVSSAYLSSVPSRPESDTTTN
jgi:hypothetical protein